MRLRSLAVLVVGILVLAPMGGWAGEGGKLKRRGEKSPGTVTKSQAARANGIELIVKARTISDLTRLVGVAPKCESLAPGSRLCSWNISNRMPGYGALASILHTRRRVFLICDLPLDNSERSPESCTLSAPKHKLAENY